MDSIRPLIFDPEHYPEDRTLDEDADASNREKQRRTIDAIIADRVMGWKCISGNVTFTELPDDVRCIVNMDGKYPSVRILCQQEARSNFLTSREFSPTRDIADAMDVLQKFTDWNVCQDDPANVMGDGQFFCYINDGEYRYSGNGKTVCEAICNAALDAAEFAVPIIRPIVELEFMVVPEQLSTLAFVPNSVRCRVIDPEAIFLTGILGESGRRLVKAGIEFYFTQSLASKLIEKGIAEKV